MARFLKLAIQKSGRLSEDSLALLADCDIKFPSGNKSRAIRTNALNFPLEILLVRDDDIPQYVADGIVDLGILGDNVRAESEFPMTVVEKLKFGHCRLSLAAPKNFEYTSVIDLQGKKIATSYPRITSEFLLGKGVKADIHVINGSVEVAPSLGLADVISDLVGTGSTLMLNGLRELHTIFESQAVLVSNSRIEPEIKTTYDRFLFRVRSVEQGRDLKYLLLNVESKNLNKITELLPGLRSPTVIPLSNSEWCAVHAVIRDVNLWEVIEQLKSAGAEGIIVSPIEKMIV